MLVFAPFVCAVVSFLAGCCSATYPAIKTYFSQVARGANVVHLFAQLQVGVGLAVLVGPAVGGVLAEPTRKYGIVGPHGLFKKYPYALPCLLTSIVGSMVCVWMYKTLKYDTHNVQVVTDISTDELSDVESTEEEDHERRTLLGSGDSNTSSPGWKVSRAQLVFFLIAFSINEYVVFAMSDVLPLWLLSKPESRGRGFAFGSTLVGITFAFAGVVMIILQVTLFSRLVNWLGALMLGAVALFAMGVVFWAMPWVSYLGNVPWLMWPSLLFLAGVVSATYAFASTCMDVVLVNAVPHADVGYWNGVGGTTASIAKFLAPAVSASLFAWSTSSSLTLTKYYPFNFHFAFLTCTVLCLGAAVLLRQLPRGVDTEHKRS